jgi:hypothetical protein
MVQWRNFTRSNFSNQQLWPVLTSKAKPQSLVT